MTDKEETKKATKVTKAKKATPREYPFLTANFFKGTLKGQINSVYKAAQGTDEKAKGKVNDFLKAVQAGKIVILRDDLTPKMVEKLGVIGITIKEPEPEAEPEASFSA